MVTECRVEETIEELTVTLNSAISQFSSVINCLQITTSTQDLLSADAGLALMLTLLRHCREQRGTVYIVGNGGSAAIASHAVIDFLNMAKMKATALLDPAVTTCFSNDYGYEHVYAKQLIQCINKNDVLIAISSSGSSKNIINAVDAAKKSDVNIITLSGFLDNNPLRKLGHYNLWLDSKDYGQVEIGHAFMLHYLTDRLRDFLIK